ncbi:MAG: U32 family peptidase C-terminal domain-containing protein, partial [Plesiomonas shigelloides]
TPSGNINFTIEQLFNKKGEAIDAAPGDGHIVYLPLPDDIELNFALLMRNLNGNTTRNPHQG